MIKINLVPEVQAQKNKQSRINYLVTIISGGIIGVVVFAIVLIGGLWAANSAMIASAKKDIAKTEKDLLEYKALEETVLSLESGLKGAKEILDNKNPWVRLFDHLEAATPADVTFSNLTFSDGQLKASLTGKTVESLGRFEESYKNYNVLVVSGKSKTGNRVKVMFDNSKTKEQIVGASGEFSLFFALAKEGVYPVQINDEGVITTLNYNTQKGTFEEDVKDVFAEKRAIFQDVLITQYNKVGLGVDFDATINLIEGVIW